MIVTMPHDGVQISINIWDEVIRPIGVVQVVHGMNDYLGRYEEFARAMNTLGYIVVGDDHRVHGKTARNAESIGVVKKNSDIFNEIMKDELYITQWLSTRYCLPIVLMGIAYGSFIIQSYLLHHTLSPAIRGIVLSGASKIPTLKLLVGELLVSGDPTKPAQLLSYYTGKRRDAFFKDGKNSWRTKDMKILKEISADPLLRDVFTKGFYQSFFRGVSQLFTHVDIKDRINLPIMLMSGDHDDACGNGRYTKALHTKLTALGLSNITCKICLNDRHELLNETNRVEVFDIIGQYIGQCFKEHTI